MRLLGEVKHLQQVKQLYYVVTTKQLFLEWLLEINLFIGRKLTKLLAIEEANEFAETNDTLDMRTSPKAVKRNVIHDEEVLKMRWDLCSSCEFLKDGKCEKCGCWMKVKHRLSIARCPLKPPKWDKYVA